MGQSRRQNTPLALSNNVSRLLWVTNSRSSCPRVGWWTWWYSRTSRATLNLKCRHLLVVNGRDGTRLVGEIKKIPRIYYWWVERERLR